MNSPSYLSKKFGSAGDTKREFFYALPGCGVWISCVVLTGSSGAVEDVHQNKEMKSEYKRTHRSQLSNIENMGLKIIESLTYMYFKLWLIFCNGGRHFGF